jgi:hypothetical protein
MELDGFLKILKVSLLLKSCRERRSKVTERGRPVGVRCREQLQCLSIASDGFFEILKVSLLLKLSIERIRKVIERDRPMGMTCRSQL